ncbi:MAG TPA: UvrD-helicase domain-containing protein [Acidimicrobiales bacterium]
MTVFAPVPRPFDACGELPTGMTLLQASAGTGKTFTIAALTTRYVAEGILPIDRLLVITFTRMATGELRERVRERLVRAFEGLVDIIAGQGGHDDDELVQLLARGPSDEVEARRDRLGKAIADFDAATIETTHGFCLQVLYGLGTAGDIDREVTLVEDVSDLMEEVVDDLFLRRFAHKPNALDFDRSDAMEIAKAALGHPDADMVPPLSQADDLPSIRRRFAKAVRQEMEDRKKARKILTYDDVLSRLRTTLFDDARGPAACARLRERYDVVLVDEFQDTDPIQWDIMHRAFGEGGATLVLIGDPKQAIYAFRGADVHTYLQARDEVQSEWTLDVNWRSDQALLEAYDALFGDAQLGSAGIAYRKVRAADANQQQRLVGSQVDVPLRARIIHGADGLVALTEKRQQPKAPDARVFIARDLAAEVVQLLSDAPELITRNRAGVDVGRTTVHPGHLAVLVRTNSQAVTVRDALRAAGVPAVIGGSGSVFATDPALEWLRLLQALERPTARDRASLAALTCFVGWTPEEVATADEGEWEALHWSLHRWATLLREQGVASLYQAVSSTHEVPERVLARPSGERFMTDLRHIAQLLHEAGVSDGLGPTAMATWLGRRIHDAARDGENEERARRLESDVEAVQVITIHRSKGLEFPIVFCPYMWDGRPFGKDTHVPMFHDPSNADRRTIDVGREGNGFAQHQKMELEEARGEDLRLLYVALTRARHQAVLWWAGAQDSQHSPLARLLFDRDAQGVVGPYGAKARSDAAIESTLAGLGPCVSVERVGVPSGNRWEEGDEIPPHLEAAVFDRTLDVGWRRASYSSITSGLHDQPAVGSEPEQQLTSDEDVPVVSLGRSETGPAAGDGAVPLQLADMPGGALVGTVIHGVFEHTEFDVLDLGSEVREALANEVAWRNVHLGDTGEVVSGLCAAIESPLGPMVDGVALRAIARADRLDELTFEIPLVGGDAPTASLHLGAVADLLEQHLPEGDPVARYVPSLRDPALGGALRGYLTGSLDLVFRLPGNRFFLADYKTNKLSPPGETLTSWHYRPGALQAEMVAAHYPLQALLYAVALHRYLRWRLHDYDPDTHLGGVLYLFVRGMSATEAAPVDAASAPGVWSWRPPASLIEAVSDLFDRGVPA